jgi:single-strand DNA-binding protein
MATTITGKLNKAANEFQAGAYTGFGIRLGKQYYDRETKQKEWTNYEAAVFSNNTQQIEFYRSNLVEGAVVELTAEAEKVKQFQGNNGLVLSIELIDCKLGYVHSGQQSQQGYAQQPQQAQQQQAPQQAPVQQAQQNPHVQYGQQPYTGQPQQAPQNNGYAAAQNGAPQGNFNQPQR